MNRLERSSTSINIATFYENWKRKKYNVLVPYQRQSGVWEDFQKSFLIDTILKNFPMPPIFLHTHIDDKSGETKYDVVDGKQRLTSIIEFIEGRVRTPDDFSADEFGIERLNGILFKDLDSPELSDWKKSFWRYEIQLEFIDANDEKVVRNIFDRLNRNGEPLNPQELRNAEHTHDKIQTIIIELSKLPDLGPIYLNTARNRLEDQEITAELLFALLKGKVLTGDNPKAIDNLYKEYSDPGVDFSTAVKSFKNASKILSKLSINYDKHDLYGLSHFYAIWYFAYIISENDLFDKSLSKKIDAFYTEYRSAKISNRHCLEYKETMQAGTKSIARRVRRINALLKYCDFQQFVIDGKQKSHPGRRTN